MEWIDVRDSLPIEHLRVLVYFPDDGQFEVARLVNGVWLDNENLDFNYGQDFPSHWMRIPEL